MLVSSRQGLVVHISNYSGLFPPTAVPYPAKRSSDSFQLPLFKYLLFEQTSVGATLPLWGPAQPHLGRPQISPVAHTPFQDGSSGWGVLARG